MLQRAGAVLDRVDDPGPAAQRGEPTTCGCWPPTSTPTWSPPGASRAVSGRSAVRRAGAAAPRWFEPLTAEGMEAGEDAAPPGRVPRAEPDRRLADARPVRRDPLPQRGDLLRRGHAGAPLEALPADCHCAPARFLCSSATPNGDRPGGVRRSTPRGITTYVEAEPGAMRARVLIVDDSATMRALIVDALTRDPGNRSWWARRATRTRRAPQIKALNPGRRDARHRDAEDERLGLSSRRHDAAAARCRS